MDQREKTRIEHEGGPAVLGNVVDSTVRTRAEEALKQYREHLEELVEERTAELRRANEQLRQEIAERTRAEEELKKKDKKLEDFVYVVSHELKAPLISLQWFSSVLLKDYHEKLEDEGRRYLERIKENSHDMEVMISDLLALSRIGQVVSAFRDVSSRKIIERACSSLKPWLYKDRIEVFVWDNLPTIHCDEARIYQVFENLLTNAVKFMGDNKSPRIEIGYEDKEDFSQFYVRDNGIGIDPRYHQKIFEIFHRLKEVEDEAATGFGLAIVERIVRHHGGKLWGESERGKGATFYFTLPKASGQAAPRG